VNRATAGTQRGDRAARWPKTPERILIVDEAEAVREHIDRLNEFSAFNIM
jgi:hypothetical protein